MTLSRFANISKTILVASAGVLLLGCAHDHHDYSDRCDEHETIVVHEYRHDPPHDHDHYHHYDGYYVDRDAYHRNGRDHDRGDHDRH